MPDFRSDLEHLINSYSKENGSDTPDFILAEYLDDCLRAFDTAVARRAEWYGVRKDEIRARVEGQQLGRQP